MSEFIEQSSKTVSINLKDYVHVAKLFYGLSSPLFKSAEWGSRTKYWGRWRVFLLCMCLGHV
eukprot:1378078-Amorphochlora_amoeboformis.AAC.1